VIKKLIVALIIIAMLALAGVAAWVYEQVTVAHVPPGAVEIVVPKGASSVKIARLLHQQQVITSDLVFRLLVRMRDVGGHLRSGYYHFSRPASMEQVLSRLQQGDVMRFQVTVPEGLRTDEMLKLLAEKTASGISVWQNELDKQLQGETEGHLLPETYQYTKPIQPGQIIKAMIRAQQDVLSKLSPEPEVQDRLRIIASIIEKETALDEERPLVSAAIHNRLKKGMPLQMDPTVIYGIWRSKGSFSGNIRKRDLAADTPWNTYTRKGLPPTPIGNPGAASLRAAAQPADIDYLYFVADGSGGHAFASTFAEHQKNVNRWMKIERKGTRVR
jgi:UPF0755 protein